MNAKPKIENILNIYSSKREKRGESKIIILSYRRRMVSSFHYATGKLLYILVNFACMHKIIRRCVIRCRKMKCWFIQFYCCCYQYNEIWCWPKWIEIPDTVDVISSECTLWMRAFSGLDYIIAFYISIWLDTQHFNQFFHLLFWYIFS